MNPKPQTPLCLVRFGFFIHIGYQAWVDEGGQLGRPFVNPGSSRDADLTLSYLKGYLEHISQHQPGPPPN